MISRKKFIQQALAASAGTALMGFNTTDSKWLSSDSSAAAADFITFDLHAHPGRFYRRGIGEYNGDEGVKKTVNEMNKGGLSGVFMSTVVDTLVTQVTNKGVIPARQFEKGEAWKEYKRQLGELKSLCNDLPARPARTLEELQDRSSGKVAIFFACEGGDFLESANQLDEMYADGVRCIQLVHYAPNPLGDLQTSDSHHNGLSKTGKAVVQKMNDLGMVIDVAHASMKTVQDVAAISNKPLILSHSILKLAEDRPISIRAITSEHAKVLASTGGVIGAWPSGFSTSFDDYINNIMRMIDVVGVDHVGLGTDMDSNFKPVFDSYLQLPKWIDALKAKGLSDTDVQKVAGGNVVRVLDKVFN
ncbi:MAG: membrane dipeptidase [Cyclobacteriaceae bacterium]